MLVLAAGSHVQLRLELHAQAQVAAPLPGGGTRWRVLSVSAGGRPLPLLRDAKGQLWTALPAGVSQVLMDADVGDAGELQLGLPLPLHEVRLQSEDWALSGVDSLGSASGALGLTRRARQAKAQDQGTQRDELPPFLIVERRLKLGITWTLETTVRRDAPSMAPVTARIRLLPGEAVTDSAVRVESGFALVQLGGGESAGFTSTLRETPRLRLEAAAEPNQMERWKLEASTRWHLGFSGLAPVAAGVDADLTPLWRPWPGESVEFTVARPAGVPGTTLTVDALRLTATPGQRASELVAELELRSSQGGNQAFELPAGAEPQTVSLDGRHLPLQVQGSLVTVPIQAGAQKLRLEWREPVGMGWFYRTPQPALGTGANAFVLVNVPPDRVILALGGPLLGPAVLFWPVLAVVAVLAVGLARRASVPLSAWAWFLLGVGLAQHSLAGAALAVGWFLALAARRALPAPRERRLFNAVQIVLTIWTLAAAAILVASIRSGLLGYPDLLVDGNASDALHLHWYQDRFSGQPASAWVLAVPLFAWRLLMLVWALWLVGSLLRWLRWGWECFSAGGYWRRKPQREPLPTGAPGAAAEGLAPLQVNPPTEPPVPS